MTQYKATLSPKALPVAVCKQAVLSPRVLSQLVEFKKEADDFLERQWDNFPHTEDPAELRDCLLTLLGGTAVVVGSLAEAVQAVLDESRDGALSIVQTVMQEAGEADDPS